MDKLTVTGVPPYDGEYEFSDLVFTYDDWRLIKLKTGMRRGEFIEAAGAGDADVDIAYTAIILGRHEIDADWKVLRSATPGAYVLEFQEDEEESPLVDQGLISGGDSTIPGSENQESDPNPIGGQPSGTSATSGPETSAA